MIERLAIVDGKKMRRLWDNYKVLNTIQKTECLRLEVAVGIRDGIKYLFIQEYYYSKKADKWGPSRHVLSIPLVVPYERGTKLRTPFADFIKTLQDVVEAFDTMELYDPEHMVVIPRRSELKKIKEEARQARYAEKAARDAAKLARRAEKEGKVNNEEDK